MTSSARHGSAATPAKVGCASLPCLNEYGQLGNDSITNRSVPVHVQGLAGGVQAIAAAQGGDHTCVLLDGGIQCWGGNGYGQLGDGSTRNSSVPVAVTGLPP